MLEYSEKVMDHFVNPRNVGELENPDGIGRVGNPTCGDIMEFQIKVDNEHLTDIKFRTFGCGAAIAVSSMVSEMAKGKALDEAMEITNKMVAKELDGLPKNKLHCSNLGADALHKAIEDYKEKHDRVTEKKKTVSGLKPAQAAEGTDKSFHCPYCETSVSAPSPLCGGCGTKLRFCNDCGCPIPRVADRCPECGAKVVKD